MSEVKEQLPNPTDDLQRAEQLIASKEYDDALGILRSFWLAHPQDVTGVRLLSRVMKALGKADLSGNLFKISEQEEALGDDLPNLCETGFNLIDAHELQLATMVLQHCTARMPNDPTVAYELGFALMSMNKFAAAIPYFEKSEDDFETSLNLCVCHMLTRNMEKAQLYLQNIERQASGDEQKKEVVHRKMVLKRLDRYKKKPTLTPRDWAFVLYGTVLLGEPNLEELTIAKAASMKSQHGPTLAPLLMETAGKTGAEKPDYKQVAWTLLILDKLLHELGYEFDLIEFYSPLSRPLAEAFAHKLDLPVKSFRGENSTDRTLMMMAWAPNIIGPHKSFTRNGRKRLLFTYGLPTTQPLPLTPDVVANLCGTDIKMPWARSADEDAEHKPIQGKVDLPDEIQADATDKIIAAIAALESKPEIIQIVQQLCDYYKPKSDELVLGNPEQFQERPTYTAEIVF